MTASFYLQALTIICLLYAVYQLVDWTWLNPYNTKKGLVLGSVVRHEEWKERDKELADLAAKKAEQRAARVERDREVVNSRIRKMYDEVNEPVAPQVKAPPRFFGGSDSTTKRQRIEPLTGPDGLDGVIGTIEGGVSATPLEYLRKFDTRRQGAFMKPRAYKK